MAFKFYKTLSGSAGPQVVNGTAGATITAGDIVQAQDEADDRLVPAVSSDVGPLYVCPVAASNGDAIAVYRCGDDQVFQTTTQDGTPAVGLTYALDATGMRIAGAAGSATKQDSAHAIVLEVVDTFTDPSDDSTAKYGVVVKQARDAT